MGKLRCKIVVTLGALWAAIGCGSNKEPHDQPTIENVGTPLAIVADGSSSTWRAELPSGIVARFHSDGASLNLLGHEATLRLQSLGRAQTGSSFSPVAPQRTHATIAYGHPTGTEWFEVRSSGVEQGVDVPQKPEGSGPLIAEVRVTGLHAKLMSSADRVALRKPDGRTVFWYGHLAVKDARGQGVPSHFQVPSHDVIQIVVDDNEATYPIQIDPLVWSDAQKLRPLDSVNGSRFGQTMSLANHEALVGAPGSGAVGGSAYIFQWDRTVEVWTQIQKLTPSVPADTSKFGSAVVLSNGQALVGAPAGESGRGSVYVYARSSDGTQWNQVQRLTVTGGAAGDEFGSTIAVAEGRAIIGAPGRNAGAGEVYALRQEPSGLWSMAGTLKTSQVQSGDRMGSALAIWNNVALVGSPFANDGRGTAQTFVFDAQNQVWKYLEVFQIPSVEKNSHFGAALAMGEHLGIFGCPECDTGKGLYVMVAWDATANKWGTQEPIHPGSGDHLGRALFIDQDLILESRCIAGCAGGYVGLGGYDSQTGSFYGIGNFSTDKSEFGTSLASALPWMGTGAPGGGYVAVWKIGLTDGDTCDTDSDCFSLHCADGVCCDSPCDQSCDHCNLPGKAGTCSVAPADSPGTPSCYPYLCSGTGVQCATSCHTVTDCAPNAVACEAEHCIARLENGSRCQEGGECKSGFCEDRVCCASACDGACARCDVPESPGTCQILTAETPLADCAPYRCGGTVDCPANCTSHKDCVDGTSCQEKQCLEATPIGQACTQNDECDKGHCVNQVCCVQADCGGYRCRSSGSCAEECATTADCASGYDCSSDGTCVAASVADDAVQGCGCRTVGHASSGTGLLLLVLALAIRRRR